MSKKTYAPEVFHIARAYFKVRFMLDSKLRAEIVVSDQSVNGDFCV